MLVYDYRLIGKRLLSLRQKAGLTQAEVARRAEMALGTYAAIERGTVNMHLDSLLHICDALGVTPDMVLTMDDYSVTPKEAELISRMDACSARDKHTALRLLEVYLQGLE